MEEKVKKWKWLIAVENEPALRVEVKYDTNNTNITFTGQYKYNIWNDFVENEYEYTNDENEILKYVESTILELRETINNIIELGEVFERIHLINIDLVDGEL